VSANRRAIFSVFFTSLTNILEMVLSAQHWTSKPYSITLHDVLEYTALNFTHLTCLLSVQVHASINAFLKLLLKTAIEIFKECRATRQYNVIVKLNAVSHRTSLDRIIDNLFNGLLPVLVNKFLKNKIKINYYSTFIKNEWSFTDIFVKILTGWKNISGPRKRS